MIQSRSWFHLLDTGKGGQKGSDLTHTLLQKSNLNQISPSYFPHSQVFSLCLFIPSALWSTRKAVKASEQNCQELCLPGFLTKSFEKPQQDGPQHILWKCCAWLQACWGRMEGFSKCHRDMKCRGNQTHRLRTSSSASCSSLIKSFQAAGDNNTMNRAS